MAFDLEQITLVGKIQPRDAETRYTAGGAAVLSFSLVCGRSKKNKDTGEWENESDWFRVTAFGKLAEGMADKALRGTRVAVTGRFSTREYESNEEKRLSLEVVADNIVVVEKAKEYDGSSQRMPESAAMSDEVPF